MTEDELIAATSAARVEPCACGGYIAAADGHEFGAVRRHIAEPIHRAWRQSREAPEGVCPVEGCATVTPAGRVCHYHRRG